MISCSPFIQHLENTQFEFNGTKYPQSVSLHRNKTINFNCLNSQNQINKILLWNSFIKKHDFGFGLGLKEPFVRNSCPVTNCEVFNNRSRLNEADLVIVHVLNEIPIIPKTRPQNQRWVFMIFESQIHSPNFSKYDNVFNLTSTHGLESNFPRLLGSYQLFEWALNENFDEKRDFSAGKIDFAVAVISNCRSSSGRLEYIKELRKYIPVTLIGKCGGIRCEDFYKTKSNAYCKDLVSTTHKFYLSFENSICDGYITEKFFVPLKFDIIPVVLGGGNYSYFVPKSGFINVLDFESPKHLAKYLLYLDQNKTAYNSYFKWKKYTKPVYSSMSTICDMCIQMKLDSFFPPKTTIISRVESFWSKKKSCKIPVFDREKKFYLKDYDEFARMKLVSREKNISLGLKII